MRAALTTLVLLLALARVASAAPATPVRVHIECEEQGRTKACPAFMLGLIDANKALIEAPRANADVVIYSTANEIAQVDRLHLRFVGTVAGAPPVIELDVDLDTRGTDDEQRAQLEAAFLRGMALYVAARYPDIVTVTFAAPSEATAAEPQTTPWGVSLTFGGYGNRTAKYKSANGYGELEVTRVTRRSRSLLSLSGNYGLNYQPPLQLDDGTEVSLDTKQWSVGGGIGHGWLYDPCWSFGAISRIERDDPKGQYRYASGTFAAVEWDKYPADDPRGNRLAVLYKAGYRVERYNIPNELGQSFAQYPWHGVTASGNVRKDKVSFGLSLSAQAEMLHPRRRHNLTASPYVEIKLGGHIDVSASFSITKREMPAPDETKIDPLDFALLSRLSYAEPLSINTSLNLTIHWDRTNGARNDRFNDI
ncbi:MAG: hypothetical protein IPQ07_13870 [Myxococcales bacterium]|nr:hypothetical protein [Myxococcales bacterium]